MTRWENNILYSWNTRSNSNSIAHFLYMDLPMYLQERRKEISVCAAWEHSQLPLKPRSVLGRFEILTFLLNLLEAPGFSIHQAHLNSQSMANDCMLLFERHLSSFCSLPSSLFRGLNAVHSGPAASAVHSQCWVQHRTSWEAVHVGRTLGQCSGTCAGPPLSARSSLRSQHTTANASDTWSLTPGGSTHW